jgi:hypothetical protein
VGSFAYPAFRVVHPADALSFIDFPTWVLLFSMIERGAGAPHVTLRIANPKHVQLGNECYSHIEPSTSATSDICHRRISGNDLRLTCGPSGCESDSDVVEAKL